MGPSPWIAALACTVSAGIAAAQDGPTMEQLTADPADYVGQTWTYSRVTLSGSISRYDAAGVRRYYLTVGSRNGTLVAGFFLAPPAMADKLSSRMSPRRNYSVNLTFRVKRIVLNDVPQWHGFVTRVAFLDGDGNVTDTVRLKN